MRGEVRRRSVSGAGRLDARAARQRKRPRLPHITADFSVDADNTIDQSVGRIEVYREDRGIAYFTVQSVEEVPKNASPGARVHGGSEASLRLITCGGRWDPFRATYVDNIIVYAALTALRPPESDSVAR